MLLAQPSRLRAVGFALALCALASSAIAAGPLRMNIAKFQIAKSSAQTSTYDPSFAVDGIVSNLHCFRTGSVTVPWWLEID